MAAARHTRNGTHRSLWSLWSLWSPRAVRAVRAVRTALCIPALSIPAPAQSADDGAG